jgi:hypothetical protein
MTVSGAKTRETKKRTNIKQKTRQLGPCERGHAPARAVQKQKLLTAAANGANRS